MVNLDIYKVFKFFFFNGSKILKPTRSHVIGKKKFEPERCAKVKHTSRPTSKVYYTEAET